jgi:hypothetical protein
MNKFPLQPPPRPVMNLFRPFLCSLPLLLTPAMAGGIEGQVRFVNGDLLSGQPGEINEQGHMMWTAANLLHQPGAIRLDTILDLRLEGGQIPATSANHDALLTLTNGDTVRGQLSALDDSQVTLDTWYAGQLRIRRSMASSLEVLRSERAVYSGPDAIENWSISGGKTAWSFHNGQLVSKGDGCIAREIELPDKCRISFTLAWRSNLKFRVLLFSNDGESATPENCYDLVCQRRFVYLRKRWMSGRGGGGSRTIGQPANIRELADKEKVHMEFFIERKTGTITFYVDGRQVQTWSDDDPEIGSFGNWLHFISEDYPLRISQLRASPWKGELPESPGTGEDEGPALEEEGQKIRLQNGDVVIGEIGEIEEGVLSIKTKHADIRIPVDRMRTINLAGGDYEEPKLMNGDVRGWLREGGRITFQLKSFSGNTLTGYSQTFGETKFDLNAFSRLEFNIHTEELDALRHTPNW